MNISLLAAVKNNLEYTKYFYKTTRELYPDVEICFSSYGSTDGTNEWLQEIQFKDPNVQCWWSELNGNFSDNFNKAASLATKDYVAFLHNDVVLAPGFIENIEKHLNQDTIVSYTTIEPPIFAGHERPGKIIYDLGVELNTFNIEGLYQFAKEKQIEFKEKTEPGIVFFMCMPKDKYLEIGGLDNLFNPMFCEDDDLILRWKLKGMNLITSLDAICYHFVSKTSRFSEEYQTKTQQIELRSNRNFVRKWGSRNPKVKYNTAFVIHNCNLQLLEVLEPWCDGIYVDERFNIGRAWDYVEMEQANTKFDLSKRVKNIKDTPTENIIIEFDATQLNNSNFQLIQQLPEIIHDSGEIGEFELDIFKITINNLEKYEHTLINL
jgi:GT2 family glycosyltransferase